MNKIFPWLRSLLMAVLVALLIFAQPDVALAKRGGGRIGGGSFRAPTRSAPSLSGRSYRTAPAPSYGGGGFGGGLFFLPFFIGGGGGSLIGLLALVAIAGVIMQAVRGASESGIADIFSGKNNITVAKVQVGLLASARQMQTDLSNLALKADTSSSAGLTTILQETTLSLLRHPEYWVYVNSSKETTKLELAEQKFNALAMSERTKLNAEVVSNVNNRVVQGALTKNDLSLEDPSEYIVVTLIAAVAGDALAKLPETRSSEDLQLSLSALGAIPQDQLLALEVLWEPQSEQYTLTSEEVLMVYPNLIRI